MKISKDKLSIVSTVLNSENKIQILINSLKLQSNFFYEWIIVDGGSTDKTVEIISNINDFKINLIEKKTSLYEGLNLAVKMCKTKYYFPIGDDDNLLNNSLKKIYEKKIFDSDAEIFVFDVMINKKLKIGFRPHLSWIGAYKVINSHSVGLIIDKNIHNKTGLYSSNYEICSDSDFIIKSLKKGIKFKYIPIALGVFSIKGKSNNNYLKSINENYTLMLDNKYSLVLQFFLLILRKIKFFLNFKFYDS